MSLLVQGTKLVLKAKKEGKEIKFRTANGGPTYPAFRQEEEEGKKERKS